MLGAGYLGDMTEWGPNPGDLCSLFSALLYPCGGCYPSTPAGKNQSIVKLSGASYTYPGKDKPQLMDINARCGLGARVAVLGANGAGKSTLIKLLTGKSPVVWGCW